MLEPSEENLTTAAIVRKYLPGLSEPEIETKLARGEIAKPSLFRRPNRQVEFRDDEIDSKPKQTNKKVTIVENKITQKKVSELFFTNIQDLNSKIIMGNVDRNVGFSVAARKVIKKQEKPTFKNHFPTFVSPRKVTMVQETNFKTYFVPPLIEKEKQDVEPAFFAGSKKEYVLPEKLPDELVFIDKNGKEVKASSSQGFTDKLSTSTEISATGNKREKTTKPVNELASKDNLECLKEDDEEEEEQVEDETKHTDEEESDFANLDDDSVEDEQETESESGKSDDTVKAKDNQSSETDDIAKDKKNAENISIWTQT